MYRHLLGRSGQWAMTQKPDEWKFVFTPASQIYLFLECHNPYMTGC